MFWNKQTKRKLTFVLTAVVLAVLSWPVVATAQEVDDVNVPDFSLPGTVEGTGTHFEVTDSNYINITFESTEPVHLRLESAPRMVVMEIEAANDANWAEITLGGFEPNTTYYKYEDNYHNEVALTTDETGSYTYTQDLTDAHHVFIQPEPGTKFIPADTSIGTWDPVTRTYTLTTDVYETIQIDEDDLTLDGAGHTVTGPRWGRGVFLSGRTGVTITNLTVEHFANGIYLVYNCHNNTLTGNTASNNGQGIRLYKSSNNTLTGNTASNCGNGIYIYYNCNNNTLTGNTASNNRIVGMVLVKNSSNNTLTGNTASNNHRGISLGNYCNNNALTGNIANSNNTCGIYLQYSSNNTLTGNTASNNHRGIFLYYSSNNVLTGNTVASTHFYGILLQNSSNNLIYNNNFIDNTIQAYVWSGSTGNIFNLSAPTGGNYWSNWTGPDADGDGFVDLTYYFFGGRDYLPLVDPVGPVVLVPTWPVGSALAESDVGLTDLTLTWTPAAHDVGIAGYLLYQDEVLIDNVTAEQLSYNVMGLEYFTEYTFKVEACNLLGSCTTDGPSVTVSTLTPVEAIEELVAEVLALNLENGVSNSLDAKLDAVLRALDDANQNNDVAAINALQAFINAVEAQSGNHIPAEDADALIATAEEAIAALSSS